jgi:hypothetical protein
VWLLLFILSVEEGTQREEVGGRKGSQRARIDNNDDSQRSERRLRKREEKHRKTRIPGKNTPLNENNRARCSCYFAFFFLSEETLA